MRLRLIGSFVAICAGTAALVIVIVLLRGVLLAQVALADGDPASDTLLVENVFYPYSATVSPALQKELGAEVASASRSRFPVKVALIGSPEDLGAIPYLYEHPQTYAQFLDREISNEGAHQPLLVVMANGYGVVDLGVAATRAAATASCDWPIAAWNRSCVSPMGEWSR